MIGKGWGVGGQQAGKANQLNDGLCPVCRETVLSEYKPRCDTQRSTGGRRSPSLDSMELEDILEKSTAGFTNSPKHKSTPYSEYRAHSQLDLHDCIPVNYLGRSGPSSPTLCRRGSSTD